MINLSALYVNDEAKFFMLLKILLLSLSIPLIGCNQQSSAVEAVAPERIIKYDGTEINGVSLVKNMGKLLPQAHYQLLNEHNQIIQDRQLTCNSQGINFSCSKINLAAVSSGFYRLKLTTTTGGLLGVTVIEINPEFIPNSVVFDEDTMGNYLITTVSRQNKLNEQQLYLRVKQILAQDSAPDYDLGTTLYDLFVLYGGTNNESNALSQINQLIVSGKNPPRETIGQARFLQPLY